jgi:hypothetical protein
MEAGRMMAFFPTCLFDGPIDIRGLGWMILDLIDEIGDPFSQTSGY